MQTRFSKTVCLSPCTILCSSLPAAAGPACPASHAELRGLPPLPPLDPTSAAHSGPRWAAQRRTRRQGFGIGSVDSVGSLGSVLDSDFTVDFGSDWSDVQQPAAAPRSRRQVVIDDDDDDDEEEEEEEEDDDSDLVQFQPHSAPVRAPHRAPDSEDEDEEAAEGQQAVVRRRRRLAGQPSRRASNADTAGLAAAAAALIAAPTSQWLPEGEQAPGSGSISDAETRARTPSQASTPGEAPCWSVSTPPICMPFRHVASLLAALPAAALSAITGSALPATKARAPAHCMFLTGYALTCALPCRLTRRCELSSSRLRIGDRRADEHACHWGCARAGASWRCTCSICCCAAGRPKPGIPSRGQ